LISTVTVYKMTVNTFKGYRIYYGFTHYTHKPGEKQCHLLVHMTSGTSLSVRGAFTFCCCEERNGEAISVKLTVNQIAVDSISLARVQQHCGRENNKYRFDEYVTDDTEIRNMAICRQFPFGHMCSATWGKTDINGEPGQEAPALASTRGTGLTNRKVHQVFRKSFSVTLYYGPAAIRASIRAIIAAPSNPRIVMFPAHQSSTSATAAL